MIEHTMVTSAFCGSCGVKNEARGAYCGGCGGQLAALTEPTRAVPTLPPVTRVPDPAVESDPLDDRSAWTRFRAALNSDYAYGVVGVFVVLKLIVIATGS